MNTNIEYDYQDIYEVTEYYHLKYFTWGISLPIGVTIQDYIGKGRETIKNNGDE